MTNARYHASPKPADAKIVPRQGESMDPEEVSLVASGQMTLPQQELDLKRFWAIGRGMRKRRRLANAIQQAIAADREDYSPLRARAKRQRD
jgi:hypothetical protein